MSLGTWEAPLSVRVAAGDGPPLLCPEPFSRWGCGAVASVLVPFLFLLGIGSAALPVKESTRGNQETKVEQICSSHGKHSPWALTEEDLILFREREESFVPLEQPQNIGRKLPIMAKCSISMLVSRIFLEFALPSGESDCLC